MVITQEDAQLVHHSGDRAAGIAIGTVEGGTGMGIEKPQSRPPGRRWHCPCTVAWCTQQSGRAQQEASSVHRPISRQWVDRRKDGRWLFSFSSLVKLICRPTTLRGSAQPVKTC